jgi:hypothetical protein
MLKKKRMESDFLEAEKSIFKSNKKNEYAGSVFFSGNFLPANV